MATWDDVRAIALGLPETFERQGRDGLRDWRVKDKGFVWERPLRRSDLAALGASAPDGPILGARVPDVGSKEALIADDPDVFFTTPHFDGYAAVLIELGLAAPDTVRDALTDGYLACAPAPLAQSFLDDG
jgi:hypothetical protein